MNFQIFFNIVEHLFIIFPLLHLTVEFLLLRTVCVKVITTFEAIDPIGLTLNVADEALSRKSEFFAIEFLL